MNFNVSYLCVQGRRTCLCACTELYTSGRTHNCDDVYVLEIPGASVIDRECRV